MYIHQNVCRLSVIRICLILLVVSLSFVMGKGDNEISSNSHLANTRSARNIEPPHIRSILVDSREKNRSTNHLSGTIQKVLPTIPLNRDNDSLYYMNVTIGTPGEKELLAIDIVEPYTWIVHNFSEIRSSNSGWRTNLSETSKLPNRSHIFHLDFVDSESVNATAVMDTLTIRNLSSLNRSMQPVNTSISQNNRSWIFYDSHELKFSNVSYFEANGSSSSKGSLGLSGRITDQGSEVDSSQFGSDFFFLENLKKNGIINSSSYSLWLGGDTRPYYNMGRNVPDEIDCGRLILGGVDPYYYSGPLKKFHKLMLLDSRTNRLSFGYPALPMGTINVVSSSGRSINVTNEDFLAPVLLDSRYPFSHLPAEAIIQVAVQIGAIYVKEIDRYIVECKIADMGVEIQFEFGDLFINVPLTDFLMSSYNPDLNSTLRFSGGAEACFMTMVSNEETGFNILGTSFLKNIYLVIDHDDQLIAIAQARRKYTSTFESDTDNNCSFGASACLSPVLPSTEGIRLITSGSIPYAVSSNETMSLTLSVPQTPLNETRIPNQFTATIFSNGLISTGKSFYNTERKSSSTSTSTDFASFSVTSASHKKHGSKDNAGHNIKPPEIAEQHWISHTFPLLATFILIMIC